MGVTVAVIGLGFGRDFVPLYRSHPEVHRVVPVDSDRDRRARVSEEFALEPGYDDLASALADPTIDAVHILTPVATHADFVIAALRAGKHVACAVPMATRLDDITRIIAEHDATDLVYVMMETAVYGREFRMVDELVRAGQFGALTMYRGFHIQNLDGYPSYWQGFPPMHYATHALSPVLALLDATVESVRCLGAGRLDEGRRSGGFDNPYPAEIALFRIRGHELVADVTMAFSQTAHPYAEGFSLFGEHRGFEWAGDDAVAGVHYRMEPPAPGERGNSVVVEPPPMSTRPSGLPPALAAFTVDAELQLDGMPRPIALGASHGGSHPYLVHEFIASVVERRASRIDARVAASWTAPGIVAHESALAHGAERAVPDYSQ